MVSLNGCWNQFLIVNPIHVPVYIDLHYWFFGEHWHLILHVYEKSKGWVFLWECAWISLTFKLMDWVKQSALPRWVALIPSVEGMMTTKRWPSPEKEGLLAGLPLSWDRYFFMPLVPNWNAGNWWISNLLAFSLNYTTSSPGLQLANCRNWDCQP